MFNTEIEAWEYNDKILSYNREVCETVLIKLQYKIIITTSWYWMWEISYILIYGQCHFADYKPQHVRTVKCQGLFVDIWPPCPLDN